MGMQATKFKRVCPRALFLLRRRLISKGGKVEDWEDRASRVRISHTNHVGDGNSHSLRPPVPIATPAGMLTWMASRNNPDRVWEGADHVSIYPSGVPPGIVIRFD